MDRRTVLICRAGLHLSAVPGVGREGRGRGRGGEEGGEGEEGQRGRGRAGRSGVEGRGGVRREHQYSTSLNQSINEAGGGSYKTGTPHRHTRCNLCCVLCMCVCGCWWVGWTHTLTFEDIQADPS